MSGAATGRSAAVTGRSLQPGVGVDVVDVTGLSERLGRSPGLEQVLFSASERAQACVRAQPALALAEAFAAKEAFLKALGRGLAAQGPDAWLQELTLERPPDGAPRLTLGARPQAALHQRGWGAPLLALARAGEHALASVLLLPAPCSRPEAAR